MTIRYIYVTLIFILAVFSTYGEVLTTVNVVSQRFEHGEMIYREDNGDIFILFTDDNTWRRVTSLQYGWLPENKLAAPDSYFSPQHGFGRIWINYDDVRDKLGWAILPEIGFATGVGQRAGIYYFERYDGKVYRLVGDRLWDVLPQVVDIPDKQEGDNLEAQEPSVDLIAVSPALVTPGGVATIQWKVSGVENAKIDVWEIDEAGILVRPVSMAIDWLPPAGTIDWGVPEGVENRIRVTVSAVRWTHFRSSMSMWAYLANDSVDIEINTGDTSIETLAAYQPFENGFMLWRADTGDVRIFYDDGRWYLYPESFYDGIQENELAMIRDCSIYPINAFAIMWGSVGNFAHELGCPVAGETAYHAIIYVRDSGTMYALPGGHTIVLNDNGWSG